MKTNLYAKLFSISALLFFTTIISAQNVGVTGYKEVTPYSQEFKKNIATSDGGIIGVSSLGFNGRACKINSSYQQVWSFGIDSIPLNDAAETNDGNYILMGHALTTNYYGAVYIFKVNPAGTLIWEKMFSSGANNQLTSCGVCKAAGTDSGFVFYGGSCVAMHYLIKCDKNGIVQWERQHVGPGNGAYLSMIAESNGYVGNFNCAGSSYQAIGISKMDVNGNVTACKVYEGANNVAVFQNSLTKKNNGDYYMWAATGDSMGMQDYIIDNALTTVTCRRHINPSGVQIEITGVVAEQNANDDILMSALLSPGYASYMKLNSSDNFVYQKQYTLFPSYFNSCFVMGGGTYGLAGSATNPGKLIAIIDETGAGVCTTTNLSMNTSNYNVFITSPTITNVTVGAQPGTPTLTLNPVTQVKSNVCGTLSTEEIAEDNSDISIYPNPANEKISIESKNKTIHTVKIINALGQVCFETAEVNSISMTIDLSALQSGFYFVEINDGDATSIKKIVKQ